MARFGIVMPSIEKPRLVIGRCIGCGVGCSFLTGAAWAIGRVVIGRRVKPSTGLNAGDGARVGFCCT